MTKTQLPRPRISVCPCALGVLLFILALAGLGAPAATAVTPAAPAPLKSEWKQALEPLASMPVQDLGFVRSAYTFGENHLQSILGKTSFQGMNALETIFYLMANPEAAKTLPLLKVRPDLAKAFGSKTISMETLQSQDAQARLERLIGNDQKLMDAYDDLSTRAKNLMELEKDFSILPRPAEWHSPATPPADATASEKALMQQWAALKQALRAGDAQAGGKAAAALAQGVESSARTQSIHLPRLGLDYFYHRTQPFRKSAILYLFAALAFGGAVLLGRPKLGWAGVGLLGLGFAAQVVGIASRWVLAGRAPLSNMYESFTFAIGGMILVALIFELVYKNRMAGMGGAVLGFIFMVLADKVPIFNNSQISQLRPALQSSWLTYHVVTIMLSYSAFALSFFVSIAYLAKDALGGNASANPVLRRLPTLESLDLFNYKIVAVGFPLLTLGIIFGAVWAATAWGRPWGFDPKETWSAITWLIYAIYLHTRYLAGWKGRSAAILALIGFAAVMFTYVGVNYLLPGLHSYV